MKARFDATGEVVVITGGAQGIGAALAAAVNAAGGTAVNWITGATGSAWRPPPQAQAINSGSANTCR